MAKKQNNIDKLNPQDYIIVKGAREHNLQNIDVAIPRDKFVVITGLSGSGKSSLAFDTLYAEGQRRNVESLSSYARQFLGKIDKPAVDYIKGISPAVAIEQKTYDKQYDELASANMGAEIDEETIVMTPPPPPPPPPSTPPPPTPEKIEVVEDDKEIEETILETTETDELAKWPQTHTSIIEQG